MIDHHAGRAIRTVWQGQMSESLEAGEALTLELGVNSRLLDNIPALVALDTLTKRTDLITPWLLMGGDGVVWASVISAGGAAGRSAGVAPLYGGADVATYMATLATLPGPSAHTRRQRMTGLPVGLQAALLPATQPGITPLWSSLPFVIGAQSQPSATSPAYAPVPVDPAQEQAQEQALPWLALLVVIGLIVSALFV